MKDEKFSIESSDHRNALRDKRRHLDRYLRAIRIQAVEIEREIKRITKALDESTTSSRIGLTFEYASCAHSIDFLCRDDAYIKSVERL